jgi:hypothetical protein
MSACAASIAFSVATTRSRAVIAHHPRPVTGRLPFHPRLRQPEIPTSSSIRTTVERPVEAS